MAFWETQHPGRTRGDDDARRGRVGAHVHHRHADDRGRAPPRRRHDGCPVDLRLAVVDCLSLHRNHEQRALDGRLHLPIGAFAVVAGDELRMDAVVSTLDGGRAPRFQALGGRDAPEALGQALAARTLATR
ncbi:MAG: hypothetical protein CL476_14675 [Acidobacteria bacterium]|nr:hypothetical protein [Acidobacteriota bacterium]